jgi:peptidoglycan/LPS O-acetylase OafA/YrhL
LARYAHRRAWRILPPYWAALVFSLLMTWFVVAQPGWPEPDGRSVVVNGLLLQDLVSVPSPNRAFWSIAVEAQLYVVLPLLLLATRRFGALTMVTFVALLVTSAGAVGEQSPTVGALVTQLTPDLAVLFAVGVLAAGVVTARSRLAGWPWHWLSAAAAVPVLGTVAVHGSVWTIGHLFWVDLALGPAIGCLLAAVAAGRPTRLVRVLDTPALRGLGSFSYSLYLTHAPIVIALYYGVVRGRVSPGVPTFLVLVAVVLPVTVVFARLFATVFELPFREHRGWAPLLASLREAVLLSRRSGVLAGLPSGAGGPAGGARLLGCRRAVAPVAHGLLAATTGRARGPRPRRPGRRRLAGASSGVEPLGTQRGGGLRRQDGQAPADPGEGLFERLGLLVSKKVARAGGTASADLGHAGAGTAAVPADVLVARAPDTCMQLEHRVLVERGQARGLRLGDELTL